jgi:hypothetical protein
MFLIQRQTDPQLIVLNWNIFETGTGLLSNSQKYAKLLMTLKIL